MKILLVTLLAVLTLTFFGCATRTMDDTSITTTVKSKLAADTDTSAIRIGVETNSGVVTLSGEVPTATEKSKAEQLAKNTEGVTRVVNNIMVSPPKTESPGIGEKTGEAITDATILTKIKTQYLAEGIIGTNVDVTDGAVVIKGEVENAAEKTKAEDIAKKTDGVKSVKNQLTIKK